ncbi:MAG: aldo/keto reductase [Planctomycetes bacterium]|nr:aldo/keto reductase [Planctomycetota bacterium]
MKYRLLGNSGLRVSELCLGTMTFGKAWGWGADNNECRKQFDLYLERGGNFIDTAINYTNGESETIVGELAQPKRDQLVLATKYTLNTRPGDPNAGGNQRKNMIASVEKSLKALRTDRIDLYWVHVWDQLTPIEEVMRGLDDLVRAGKVLYVGISDYPAWKVAEANTLAKLRGWTPFVALQIEHSLAQRDVERDLLPMARDLGLGVTPWGPLASGLLTGKYSKADIGPPPSIQQMMTSPDRKPMVASGLTERKLAIAEEVKKVAKAVGRTPAQVALRWLMQRPGITSVILGARTSEQLKDNLGAAEFELAGDHIAALDKISAIELGFPHAFINGPMVQQLIHGGVRIEPRV